MAQLPTVLVHRLPRLNGAWEGARSWFGGAPRLGDTPWPRSPDTGVPLVFVAQLDLAELAAAGPSPLPSEGSLAFFLGTDRSAPCAVRHVPSGLGDTPVPPDALPADQILGGYPPERQLPDAPRTFPRWPVGLVPLDLPAGLDPAEDPIGAQDAQIRAVTARLPRRPVFLSAKGAWREALDQEAPVWWGCAQRFARQLREAQLDHGRPIDGVPRAASFVGRLLGRSRVDAFDELVQEVHAWVVGRDPWAPMDPASAERLRSTVERVRRDFRKRAHHRPSAFLTDLQDAVFRSMLTAEPAVWERLPLEVRALVDGKHLLASSHWHQVFGFGCDIQGAAVWEHEDDLLLLQLAYDDLLEWVFGDMGVYILWVSPRDAAAGDFSRVQATFECS